MALTGNCSDMPTLFIDTHVPLDILSDFAQLCVIPLRDGCDVLDVIGGRLRGMTA